MTGHMQSTGRGGAGNFGDASKSPRLGPKDLETPTLKKPVITTGRGGSGNMAANKDPAETRARQDVTPITRRPSEGAAHFGRGGAANVAKLGAEDIERAKKTESAIEEEPPVGAAPAGPKKDGGNKNFAAKGKEWLLQNLGKKA